jgi:hypothetical protein
MKKHIVLISVGILNLLHGAFHIIQFIQSAFFVAYATHHHQHNESLIEEIIHSPIFALIMGLVGVLTLVIGIKDFRHHQKCQTKTPEIDNTDLKKVLEEKLKEVKELEKKIQEQHPKTLNEFIYWN